MSWQRRSTGMKCSMRELAWLIWNHKHGGVNRCPEMQPENSAW